MTMVSPACSPDDDGGISLMNIAMPSDDLR